MPKNMAEKKSDENIIVHVKDWKAGKKSLFIFKLSILACEFSKIATDLLG